MTEKNDVIVNAAKPRLKLRLANGVSQDAYLLDITPSSAEIELPRLDNMPVAGQQLVVELLNSDNAPPRIIEVTWSGAPQRPVIGARFVTEMPDGIHQLDIERVKVDPQVALRFPAARARRWQVLPFAATEDCVMVATADTLLTQTEAVLDRAYRRQVKLHFTDPEALRRIIERVYAGAEVLAGGSGRSGILDLANADVDTLDAVALYDQILASAIVYGASDIHIDSFEERIRVRVRVDGQIEPLIDLGIASGFALISRIKVMAGLDISERRAPQDGRLRYQNSTDAQVDMRVATLPTKYGERLTLRLLAQNSGDITLESLGMSSCQLEEFRRAIRQPYGLILLTGPTGSGKSTTLYAALRQLISESDLNVITIEDPIEYQIPGVTQVEVDPAEKVTFPKALRSTLRHDPDVVMVGEIRDSETADIAVKAALTGHLVFSTLHTNDAAGAITRLTDMGVPSFLVAATLRLVVAQRLVRRLCSACAMTGHTTPAQATSLGKPDLVEQLIKQPVGCLYCGNRGYTGRLALFEMLTVNRYLSQLIAGNVTEGDIKAYLQKSGLPTLADDATEKLLDGRTSIAEVLRNVVSFADLTESVQHTSSNEDDE